MKKSGLLIKFLFSVILTALLTAGLIFVSDASPDAENIIPEDLSKHGFSGCMLEKKQTGPGIHNIGKVQFQNNVVSKGTPSVQTGFSSYSGQAGILRMTQEIKNQLVSYRPDIKYAEDSHFREVFMVIHLDNLLSPGLTVMKNLEGSKYLLEWLNTPPELMITDNISLKPNLSASYMKSDDTATSIPRHSDLIFKPLIRNPFHNGAISLSLPIPLTESLTISPAITYAFSINDTVRQEYRGKSLINLIDKDSAIVYTGIHLKYSF